MRLKDEMKNILCYNIGKRLVAVYYTVRRTCIVFDRKSISYADGKSTSEENKTFIFNDIYLSICLYNINIYIHTYLRGGKINDKCFIE